MANLKSSLLKLIRVKDFSAEAEFKDPCLSFVVTEVICAFCNKCRDFDLCRDKDLTEGGAWRCPECEHAYDRDAVEQRIVDTLLHQSMAFQLQDLVCAKCRAVKAENVAEHCHCSGRFTETASAPALLERAAAAFRLAEFHRLEQLRDVAAWLLRRNGVALPERLVPADSAVV